jgi:hypothetical protein
LTVRCRLADVGWSPGGAAPSRIGLRPLPRKSLAFPASGGYWPRRPREGALTLAFFIAFVCVAMLASLLFEQES